ncbi:MAG: translation initiation factor IF-2 [Clostridia bacterium]|nr:translation initiation factor IF-2 [Clostridia bacterium]
MAIRVYELSKELKVSNKELIEKMTTLGIQVKSHMSVLTDADTAKVRGAYAGGGAKAADAKAAQSKPTKREAAPAAKGGKTAEKPAGRAPEKKAAPAAHGGEKRQAKPADKPQGGQKHRADEKAGASRTGGQPSRNNGPQQGKGGNDRRRDDRQGRTNAGNGGKQRQENRNRGHQGPGGSNNQNGQNGGQNRNERRGGKNQKNGRNDNGRSSVLNIAKPQHHTKKKDVRKEQRKEAAKQAELEAEAIPAGAVVVSVPITVAGLAEQIDVSTSQLIMTLMKMGIMANINQNLDEDIVQILGEELGKQIIIGEVEDEASEEGIENFEDKEEDLKPRPPIITVMGHVDHGKTSLLDRIRNTSVTSGESGGITQHIGASEINYNGQRIVFLDTPGHEAFTAMRARGAYVTDIAVLVVAADDSVKPQTIEAISHAKAANVPIIVAINKMDKPGANPDRVKKDLADHSVLVEDWGGDVISVNVSAKTGDGIDNLLEMILLQAEMLELKANPARMGLGTVVEARLDKQRGPVATLLVQNGTLRIGNAVVAGNCSGRIKAMTNYKGKPLKKAGPATAVEILGMDEVPEAGDQFNVVKSDKIAREIADKRKEKQREEVLQKSAGVTLEQLFSQIEQGEVKDLNLVVKADVQGSVGALVTSLEKLSTENVQVKIVHTGVGAINESDVMLASTTGAIIIGFNVRPSAAVTAEANRQNVEIRTYRVIYEALEEVENAIKGMLDPEFKEEVIGSVEVRETFKVPNVGMIAGSYVIDGKIERNAEVRLIRDGIVIHEGKVSSLRRFKDDVKEVAKGFECGVGIEDYNDLKVGDVIEAFKMVEVERK